MPVRINLHTGSVTLTPLIAIGVVTGDGLGRIIRGVLP